MATTQLTLLDVERTLALRNGERAAGSCRLIKFSEPGASSFFLFALLHRLRCSQHRRYLCILGFANLLQNPRVHHRHHMFPQSDENGLESKMTVEPPMRKVKAICPPWERLVARKEKAKGQSEKAKRSFNAHLEACAKQEKSPTLANALLHRKVDGEFGGQIL